MKISVFGLWHLGSVTAACLADAGHIVVGVDEDSEVIGRLNSGIAPVFEPGLDDLIKCGISSSNLDFRGVGEASFIDSDVVWVTYDTPVDNDDQADIDSVIKKVTHILPLLSKDTVVLVSSQLPVGSVGRLEKYANDNYPLLQLKFACSPENLRLGKAIKVFSDPDRVIIGVRSDATKTPLLELLRPITDNIEWMSIESAEMTKHAINAFLATSITFTNELASICEQVGANAKEVERGLKTEVRIGPEAYVSPGGPFAGGTLARDIGFLCAIASDSDLITPVISSVRVSNDEHKNWARKRLIQHFGSLRNITVAVWGLTYKPGTSTLRRSTTVELCDWILSEGGAINVFDPVVKELPTTWGKGVSRYSSGKGALEGADVLVVATEWPELKEIALDTTPVELGNMLVVDANGFLKAILADKAMKYYVVGEHILEGATLEHLGTAKRVSMTKENTTIVDGAGEQVMKKVLANRQAIITGGNQGLGLEIALNFVAAGADVMICGRNPESLEAACAKLLSIAESSQKVAALVADVSKPSDVERVFAETISTLGGCHILVNNAGVYGPKGNIESIDWNDWLKTMEININGSVLMSRAVLPYFKERRYGKIIQLSGGGATNPLPRISAYAVSKAAIVRFAETLAEEVRGLGIDVNAIAPGALNTGMLDEILAAGPEKVGAEYYEKSVKQKESGGAPLSRGAELAVFLASSKSDGITAKLISAIWDGWEDWDDNLDALNSSDVYTLRRITGRDRGLDLSEK